jgi:cytochrome c oxidase cbb3-type subunit 3
MSDQIKKDNEPNLILDDERDLLLDHEYDGIQELDNNMPPWWIYGFYFTIAFSVVYLLYYEVTGWGPSQEQEYEIEMALAEERFGAIAAAPEDLLDFTTLAVLTDDVSLATGKALYEASRNLCTTCHGAQGQGLVGPNLTNEYWKHGCDLASIATSIRVGFPARGMPAYGSMAPLNDEQLHQLSSYIISLRGSNPPGAKAPDMSRSVVCPEVPVE